MGKHTPLYDKHIVMGAKMVDFGGWDMPLRYGSQIDEHHQVRNDCGMFDVSHMTVVDFRGMLRGRLEDRGTTVFEISGMLAQCKPR